MHTNNPFTRHPHAIGETYWQHQRRALRFAFSLWGAGLAALVHALLPFLFVETASRTIKALNQSMMAHRSHAAFHAGLEVLAKPKAE